MKCWQGSLACRCAAACATLSPSGCREHEVLHSSWWYDWILARATREQGSPDPALFWHCNVISHVSLSVEPRGRPPAALLLWQYCGCEHLTRPSRLSGPLSRLLWVLHYLWWDVLQSLGFRQEEIQFVSITVQDKSPEEPWTKSSCPP